MAKDLIAYLSKTLGRENDSDAVASLFNEDGSPKDENTFKTLLDWDTERIKAINEKHKNSFDNGYKKAEKESKTAIEKTIKEVFGYDGDEVGEDLINAIKTKVSTASTSTITEDEIKRHPAYLKLESTYKKDLKEALEQGDAKLTEFKNAIEQENLFSKISKMGLEIVLAEKPILPTDEAKKNRRLATDIIEPMKAFKYEPVFNANGEIESVTVLDKDGKRLEDAHGNVISYKDHVLSIANKNLEFDSSNSRKSPHESPPPPSGGGAGTPPEIKIPKFETKQQYLAYIADDQIPIENRSAAAKLGYQAN